MSAATMQAIVKPEPKPGARLQLDCGGAVSGICDVALIAQKHERTIDQPAQKFPHLDQLPCLS